MLSFHNEQAVKDKYVNRVIFHQEADNLIRGIGWTGGKGCAVGCTLENYDHTQYPVELGIPEWLAQLEDGLFEGMTEDKSKTWPQKFLESIPLGIGERDFEIKVKAPFLVFILRETLNTFDNEKYEAVTAAVNGAITLWQRNDIGSRKWNEAAARAAKAAAWAAARAAIWAARAARAPVWAALAAGAAAGAASWASWATAAAALATAAASTAEAEAFDKYADKLIELLQHL